MSDPDPLPPSRSTADTLLAALVLACLVTAVLAAGGACRLLPSASPSPDAGPADELHELAQLLDAAEAGMALARLACAGGSTAEERGACDGDLDAVESGLAVAEGAVRAGEACQRAQDAACRAAALATAREQLPHVRALVAGSRRGRPRASASGSASTAPPAPAVSR
jgi:hypothetical protein